MTGEGWDEKFKEFKEPYAPMIFEMRTDAFEKSELTKKLVKGAVFSLATVFVTVMLKMVDLALLGQTTALVQVVAVQYEFIVIAVSILVGGHTAMHATAAERGEVEQKERLPTFFWPLFIVMLIALGTLCSLAVAGFVASLMSGEHAKSLAITWLTIVVPDLLGVTAIVVAVFATLRIDSRA